jgi:Protein of unknown function (DUF3014)
MNLSRSALVTICIMIATGAGAFLLWQRFQTAPPDSIPEMKSVQTQAISIPEAVASQPTKVIAEHLPAGLVSPSAEPVVPLDDSDSLFRHALSGLMGDRSVGQFFLTDQMVRKFVATVDNLPRQAAPMQMRPVKAMPGHFETSSSSTGGLSIASTNTTRYVGFIDAVSMVNLKSLVKLYATHYALFQQAYRELGYPKGYFNNRLLVAIDDMLATEDLVSPIALLQPKVLYEFSDPNLESLSAGQKIMTRIGMSNAQRLRKLLKALRIEITRLDTDSALPEVKPS